jgi:acetylornithine deacetylase
MPPTDEGARRAILAAVDALRDEALATLVELVGHASLLGQEQGALEAMAGLYAGLGLEVRRIPVEVAALEGHRGWSPPLLPYEGRDNVVALHQPRAGGGRSLALNGHVDVVPEGAADMWASPPYRAELRDGRVYGRGAGDMKAGLVSSLMAFKALRLAGLQPAGAVQLQAVIEEECTGNGALAVMQALPKPDAVIIPEPGPGVAALYTAEVGVIWAWVTISGRPAHVRDMHAGISAIEAAGVIASAFKRYEERMNRAEQIHPSFHGVNHPVNVNLGTFQGGEWNSSVATRARLGLRVGVMVGHDPRAVAREIEALVAEAARDPRLAACRVALEFKGFMAEGCVFDQEAEIVRLARRCYAEASGGTLRDYPATGLTDGRHWVLYQGTPVAVFGPDAQEIHGIDESVGVESMHAITRSIALAMADWCGVESTR